MLRVRERIRVLICEVCVCGLQVASDLSQLEKERMRRKREAEEQVCAIEERGREAAARLQDAVRERDALEGQILALSRQKEELSRQKEVEKGEEQRQALCEWEVTALSKLRVLRESGEGRVVLVRKSDYEAKKSEISRLRLEVSSLAHSITLNASQASSNSISALSASAASANDTFVVRSPNDAAGDNNAGGMDVSWDVQPVTASASPSQRANFDNYVKGASHWPRNFDSEYDKGISRGTAAAAVSLLKTGGN